MTRINPATTATSDTKAAELLAGIEKKAGFIPNVLGTIGQSGAALAAYSAFGQALGKSKFDAKERELIAVAVSATNDCGYCVSGHGAFAKGAGASHDEVLEAIRGTSSDPRLSAALTFAQAVTSKKGFVDDEELAAVREAGLSDGELIELVAIGIVNAFTNFVVHVADVELDFPEIEIAEALAS